MPCDGTISQEWSYSGPIGSSGQYGRLIRNRYSLNMMDASGAQIVAQKHTYPVEAYQRFKIIGGVDQRVAAPVASPRASEPELQR